MIYGNCNRKGPSTYPALIPTCFTLGKFTCPAISPLLGSPGFA